MTACTILPLGSGTRRKHSFQTPSQEFVTQFSWTRTPLHGLQKRTRILPQAFACFIPLGGEPEENYQLLISMIFILPFATSNKDKPGILQTFQCARHKGKGQPLRRERETIRQAASDELDPLETSEPSDPPVENHHTFSRLVLTLREDHSLVFTSHDCATESSANYHGMYSEFAEMISAHCWALLWITKQAFVFSR